MNRSWLTGREQRLRDLRGTTGTGRSVLLPGHARSLVLLLLHDTACSACASFCESLGPWVEELNDWAADLATILPPGGPADAAAAAASCVITDPDGRVQAIAQVAAPAVVIVDQWGELADVWAAGAAHEFPGVARIVGSVRYLATRCPECEGEAL